MEIKKSPSGTVVRSLKGYYSFVPNPLPPTIEWTTELVQSLSRADNAVARLSQQANKMPIQNLFMRSFATKEAVLSSRIEGTQATLEDMLTDAAGAQVERHDDEVQEVKNYLIALDYGIQRIDDFPLSLRVIREIHEKLMQGVRGGHATPGEFRRSQNWIGVPGCTLLTAKYIPTAPEELGNVLAALENYLHNKTLPNLVHNALCHYQFEAIHPFLDGNGRTGRLLITLLLAQRNVLTTPILYLSAFFEATRTDYYRYLYNVSAYGNWQEWLIYFLHGVASQSEDVLSRIERIQKLINDWQQQISKDSSKAPGLIIAGLSTNPILTITQTAQTLGIAFTTAKRAIDKLEDLGIIQETTAGKKDRVYCATRILDILQEPTKITNSFE